MKGGPDRVYMVMSPYAQIGWRHSADHLFRVYEEIVASALTWYRRCMDSRILVDVFQFQSS